MFLQRFMLFILVIAILAPIADTEAVSSELMKEQVISYFEKVFDLPQADIRLKFVHLPETKGIHNDHYHYVIEANRMVPQLGYQTLWLAVLDNQYLVKRLPITVDVSIYLDVTVAVGRLKRGELVTAEKVTTRRVRVSRDYESLVTAPELVVGLITKQVIETGTILRRSMLRAAPDVRKGEEVKIQLVSGDLVITTDGEVKQDGMIGDRVKVICTTTRKQLLAIVQSSRLVVVHLR